MVKDVPGQDDEASLEFGVHYDLAEGEELPEDHNDLTDAQYTIFRMLQVLRGTFDEKDIREIKGEAGSGILVHK